MGQEQYKNEGKKQDGVGGIVKHDVKSRAGASFQDPHAVNSLYGKGGKGPSGNPGKPT